MFQKILAWVSVGAVAAAGVGSSISQLSPKNGQLITSIAAVILAVTKSILPNNSTPDQQK